MVNDELRDRLRLAIQGVTFNSMNHPAPLAVLGKSCRVLNVRLLEAVEEVLDDHAHGTRTADQ